MTLLHNSWPFLISMAERNFLNLKNSLPYRAAVHKGRPMLELVTYLSFSQPRPIYVYKFSFQHLIRYRHIKYCNCNLIIGLLGQFLSNNFIYPRSTLIQNFPGRLWALQITPPPTWQRNLKFPRFSEFLFGYLLCHSEYKQQAYCKSKGVFLLSWIGFSS